MSGKPLAGRVAVVTGAGRGIGRAHAHYLAQLGASIVVSDRGVASDGTSSDSSVAAAVVAELDSFGAVAIPNNDDIGSYSGAESLIAKTLEHFGRIDILINNAGIVSGGGVEDLDEETLVRLIGVNCVGAIGAARAALPTMLHQGHGRIINTVSEAALDTRFAGSVGYAAAKGAIWGATLSLAAQVEGTGITVNAISPGARTRLNEEMFRNAPTALDLDPFHIARAVAWLVSDDAADVNGKVLHAAAGAIREYNTARSASDLSKRAEAGVAALPAPLTS